MTETPVVSVMLVVPDAAAAIAWYRDALGATELWDLGGVAGLSLGGAAFFLHEVTPHNPLETSPAGTTHVRVELFTDAPEDVIARAAAAGATAVSEVVTHEMPWGARRQGRFTDPFGHKWSMGDRSPLKPFPG